MNWIDINTPPTHSNDVLIKFDVNGGDWQKGYLENNTWYNEKSDPFTELELKYMTEWSEVELPEIKQTEICG